jgi:hypothetical protein
MCETALTHGASATYATVEQELWALGGFVGCILAARERPSRVHSPLFFRAVAVFSGDEGCKNADLRR